MHDLDAVAPEDVFTVRTRTPRKNNTTSRENTSGTSVGHRQARSHRALPKKFPGGRVCGAKQKDAGNGWHAAIPAARYSLSKGSHGFVLTATARWRDDALHSENMNPDTPLPLPMSVVSVGAKATTPPISTDTEVNGAVSSLPLVGQAPASLDSRITVFG